MTTIVALRRGTHACIAADTLAKYGNALEPAGYVVNSDKLMRVGDAWIGPTGPASAQLVLASYFAHVERPPDFTSTQAVFETFLDLHGALKDDFYLNPKEDDRDPYESSQMEIMVVSPAGLFGVYPLRSVQEYSRFYAFGSGAEYALGSMYADWERIESIEEIARRALAAAAEFDDSTALPLTLHTVELRQRVGVR